MDCPRTVHGLSTDCPWTVHGLSMDCPWTVHGKSMDCPWTAWTVHGLSMDRVTEPITHQNKTKQPSHHARGVVRFEICANGCQNKRNRNKTTFVSSQLGRWVQTLTRGGLYKTKRIAHFLARRFFWLICGSRFKAVRFIDGCRFSRLNIKSETNPRPVSELVNCKYRRQPK